MCEHCGHGPTCGVCGRDDDAPEAPALVPVLLTEPEARPVTFGGFSAN